MLKRYKTEIKGGSGLNLKLKKNEKMILKDNSGGQSASVLIYFLDDFQEFFSPSVSMELNSSANLSKGDILFSGKLRPLIFISEDSVKKNDCLVPPCFPNPLEREQKETNGLFCSEILEKNLSRYRVPSYSLGQSLNIFSNLSLGLDLRFEKNTSQSLKGAIIEFEALSDCFISLTNCPNIKILEKNSFGKIIIESIYSV